MERAKRKTDRPDKKGKGSPYSITERRVPELIPVLYLFIYSMSTGVT